MHQVSTAIKALTQRHAKLYIKDVSYLLRSWDQGRYKPLSDVMNLGLALNFALNIESDILFWEYIEMHYSSMSDERLQILSSAIDLFTHEVTHEYLSDIGLDPDIELGIDTRLDARCGHLYIGVGINEHAYPASE